MEEPPFQPQEGQVNVFHSMKRGVALQSSTTREKPATVNTIERGEEHARASLSTDPLIASTLLQRV